MTIVKKTQPHCIIPRAEDVCLGPKHTLQLLSPSTPVFSGALLKSVVMLGESEWGVKANSVIARVALPGLIKKLRFNQYPEDPRLSCRSTVPAVEPHADCTVVTSLVAADRVAAALDCIRSCTLADTRGMPQSQPTIQDYHRCYTTGGVTPSVVAERAISLLETHNPKQHWLSAWSAQHIREAAAAATERYAAGKPLSVLDGVPFVVKDNIDALPYETSYGTRFMGKLRTVTADAPCVAALKELGAVLLGKASLVEFGCTATGYNTHAGSPLNPHNPNKAAGGSSSGSAAAVAAGLCPFAIGTDGGGSIRIPSSFCGVVGLKPTKGRLADDHDAHGCFSSVTVTGPIAVSVADLMLVYAAISNVDYPHSNQRRDNASRRSSSRSSDVDISIHSGSSSSAKDTLETNSSGKGMRSTKSDRRPPVPSGADAAVAAAAAATVSPLQCLELPQQLLPAVQQDRSAGAAAGTAAVQPLAGMRIGIYPQWFDMCNPGVQSVVNKAVDALASQGATRTDLLIPELDLVQVAHSVVFSAEYYYDAGQAGWRDVWELRRQLNLDTRLFYGNSAIFTDEDYTAALRIRARAMQHFERAFQQCDVIVTPTTPTTADTMTAAVHTSGVYDLARAFETVRFTQAANLTGLPALSFPAGRVEEDGMPVGVQLIGAQFAEATLLKAAAALEGCLQPVVPELVMTPFGQSAAAGAAGWTSELPYRPHDFVDDTERAKDSEKPRRARQINAKTLHQQCRSTSFDVASG